VAASDVFSWLLRIKPHVTGIRKAKTTSATTVYDPTCGSGSSLLKVGDEAKIKPTLYGKARLHHPWQFWDAKPQLDHSGLGDSGLGVFAKLELGVPAGFAKLELGVPVKTKGW